MTPSRARNGRRRARHGGCVVNNPRRAVIKHGAVGILPNHSDVRGAGTKPCGGCIIPKPSVLRLSSKVSLGGIGGYQDDGQLIHIGIDDVDGYGQVIDAGKIEVGRINVRVGSKIDGDTDIARNAGNVAHAARAAARTWIGRSVGNGRRGHVAGENLRRRYRRGRNAAIG